MIYHNAHTRETSLPGGALDVVCMYRGLKIKLEIVFEISPLIVASVE